MDYTALAYRRMEKKYGITSDSVDTKSFDAAVQNSASIDEMDKLVDKYVCDRLFAGEVDDESMQYDAEHKEVRGTINVYFQDKGKAPVFPCVGEAEFVWNEDGKLTIGLNVSDIRPLHRDLNNKLIKEFSFKDLAYRLSYYYPDNPEDPVTVNHFKYDDLYVVKYQSDQDVNYAAGCEILRTKYGIEKNHLDRAYFYDLVSDIDGREEMEKAIKNIVEDNLFGKATDCVEPEEVSDEHRLNGIAEVYFDMNDNSKYMGEIAFALDEKGNVEVIGKLSDYPLLNLESIKAGIEESLGDVRKLDNMDKAIEAIEKMQETDKKDKEIER